MEFVDDVHQEFDVKITLGQFKNFLVAAGRSDRCPVCPHRGEWNFYIDKTESANDSSFMALTPNLSQYHSQPDDTFYVIVMDCPNCGHMVYTSSKSVLDWLGKQERVR